MDSILDRMISQYECKTINDKKNSIKEVVQEIILCGLSRAGFFDDAAFYGGTALRIFYGLDRFSEDLDFSLIEPNKNFCFEKYLPILEKEVRSYGLNFNTEVKEKTVESNIASAFLKGNTKEHVLTFFADENTAKKIASNEVIKIKLEVDVNPPQFATYERKYRLLPIPYFLNSYDAESLFAGKLHAVICRSWKSRVKGRDLYDFIFYIQNNIRFNLKHLNARLEQTGFIPPNAIVSEDNIKNMLKDHLNDIDYAQAKEDVFPFIKDPKKLEIWNADFFVSLVDSIKAL